ncbi:hypothetical protein Agub_g1347 [Astrephomene gubernaculifera]|uniref:Uncharacterized protein n=1 Tax=Astrephomene gubernaculifera TaxID=47775 RepID=A0AAD3DHX6_9CHLO|nr:hypothetical protein Agub_g1347 [Astrephomene gubernaculifera]
MAPLRRLGGLAQLARCPLATSTPSLSHIAAGTSSDSYGAWPRNNLNSHHGVRHSSTSTSSSLSDLPPLAASSALEDSAVAALFNPAQLGTQVWEGAHAAWGLPWWATIPAATLGLRAALLPLSLRAYAASANVALLHRAVGLAGEVGRAVAEAQAAGRRTQQQEEEDEGKQQQQPSSSSSTGSVELGRVDLVRRVLAHLRQVHGAPSFGWYLGNAAVQAPLLLSLTSALQRMSDTMWPGLNTEGTLYFGDLTSPPVFLQTMSTPYGTAGAMIPLALVLLYVSAVDKSAGAGSPGINAALKLLAVPLYCASLLQPHAVLLYWLTHAASQLGLYGALERLPGLRRAVGAPELLVEAEREEQGGGGAGAGQHQQQGAEEASSPAGPAVASPSLDDLLLALSESYQRAGRREAARGCLHALLARQPHHPQAAERLRQLEA